jgi:hypothetical protein
MKVKVEDVVVGNFDVDSITVTIKDVITQICFPKNINIAKYNGTEIELTIKDGIYAITEITKK